MVIVDAAQDVEVAEKYVEMGDGGGIVREGSTEAEATLSGTSRMRERIPNRIGLADGRTVRTMVETRSLGKSTTAMEPIADWIVRVTERSLVEDIVRLIDALKPGMKFR